MPSVNATATFTGFGLLEFYSGAHPGNRIFNRVYGETVGYSADPAFAPGGPEADPSVKALQKGMKTRHGMSETGGPSGPIVW